MRCPDVAAAYQHNQKVRDEKFICPFGTCQFYCRTWRKFCKKKFPDNIHFPLTCHCTLDRAVTVNNKKIYVCRRARERAENAKKQKHHRIDNSAYRKISSAAHYLVKTSPYKSLFLLLSFPPWKPGFNPYKNEKQLNECFSRFVHNLRENYNCQGYIAVRELGEHTRRYHYHLVCSIPFVPFADLNNAWCAAVSDICEFSKNALQSRAENRIIERLESPARAVRYICKYISKTKGQSSKSRILFMSNNLIKRPVAVRNEENKLYDLTGIMDVTRYLLQFKSLTVTKLNDYCTAFRINSNADFDKICEELIYPAFHCDLSKPISLYAYPDKKTSGP